MCPTSTNEVGTYRTTFELPAEWAGMRVYVVFGGVESAFYAYLNGQEVGYSQDSRLPAEFEITAFVTAGRNVLSAQVYRWSDAVYIEDQDHWRMAGLHRSVYLYATPAGAHRRFQSRHRAGRAIPRRHAAGARHG